MEALAIAPDTVVTLSYALFDERGEVIDGAGTLVASESAEASPNPRSGDSPCEPLTYVHGYAQIVPGLERQIEGLHKGERRTFTMAPDEAFGDRDEDAVFEVEKSDFPDADEVTVGDEFMAEGPDGEPFAMRVVEVKPDGFLMDANHPLAGQTLRVEVAVEAVRTASEEEITAAQAALEDEAGVGWGCGHDHDHDHDHDHEHEHDDHDHEHEHVPLIQIRKTC
jgi:FKBP-type peptidyl-prolyl cis-trans isomerase SlyD